MPDRVTLQELQQMKREGRKSVCIVTWDAQMARIVDAAGVDLISVGDSVGVNLWGRSDPLDVTLEEMILVAAAVRRGADRTLVSCDFPFGPLQDSPERAVQAARRIIDESGVDLVKLDDAADHLAGVEAVASAGVPVFAQFGISPQNAARYGVDPRDTVTSRVAVPDEHVDRLVEDALRLESAGASLLNFSNSGPVAGPAVVDAVRIPVLGGSGGGPWLDGRIRLLSAAVGYDATTLEGEQGDDARYASVAHVIRSALNGLVDDIRSGRVLRGQPSEARSSRRS